MQLIKRTRDKSSGNQDNANSDGGDLLPATASSPVSGSAAAAGGSGGGSGGISSCPIISPRKSIRNYSCSSSSSPTKQQLYEDSFLLYKGRKSYLMVPVSKALTWLMKIGIYYHHKQYLTKRLLAYFSLIIIAGLVRDFLLASPSSPLPISVLEWINLNLRTHKRNFLNLYFVKLGWLWTFISLIPFFLYTRFYLIKRSKERDLRLDQGGLSSKRKKSVHFREPLEDRPDGVVTIDRSVDDQLDKRVVEVHEASEGEETTATDLSKAWKHTAILIGRELFSTFIRLAVATLIWYYSVNFFVYYANLNGECRLKENATIIDSVNDRVECERLKGKWQLGFDISGHIFLMVFSNLIRIEELTFLSRKFEEFTVFRYISWDSSRSMNYATPYRFRFSPFHLLALLTVTVNVVVTLVWDFMIIQTSFFYHTWEQKVAGFMWAMLAWAVTYGAAFKRPQLRLQVAPL